MIRNIFCLLLLLTLWQTAVSAQAFPRPVQGLKLGNTLGGDSKNKVKAGESASVFLDLDRFIHVNSLKLNDQELEFTYVCELGTCKYAAQKAIVESDELGLVDLSIEYKAFSTLAPRKLVFKDLNLRIYNPEAEQLNIEALSLSTNNDLGRPAAFPGETINLNITASASEFAKISSLEINDEIYSPEALAAVNAIEGVYSISYTIPEAAAGTVITFKLHYKVDEDRTIIVNATTDSSFINVLDPNLFAQEPTEQTTDSLSVRSSNAVNNKQAAADDVVIVEFLTANGATVNEVKFEGYDYSKQVQSNCNETQCLHTISFKPYEINQSKLAEELYVVYTEKGVQRIINNLSNKLWMLRDYKLSNLLDRVTFGGTPAQAERLRTIGFDAFLEQQLHPFIDASYEAKIDEYAHDPEQLKHQKGAWIAYRIMLEPFMNDSHSLQNVMGWFWENHFSTVASKFTNQNTFRAVNGADFKTASPNTSVGYSTESKNANASLYNPHVELYNIDLTKFDRLRMILAVNTGEPDTFTVSWGFEGQDYKLDVPANQTVTFDYVRGNQYTDIDISSKKRDGKLAWIKFKQATEANNPNGNKMYLRSGSMFFDSKDIHNHQYLFIDRYIAESVEQRFYRRNSLGNFYDLLKFSAHSPVMMMYLDNWRSRKGNPNENYGREILELHSLGVNNYSQEDVEAVARIFTGWTVRNNDFYFYKHDHDTSAETLTFTSTPIPQGYKEQGDLLLRLLADNPATAKYICTKLVHFFVSEEEYTSLVASCADTFLANKDKSDQIVYVVKHVLSSNEFMAAAAFKSKVSTPLNYIISTLRKLDTHTVEGSDVYDKYYRNVYSYLSVLGYAPFLNPVPTGYEDRSELWFNQFQFNHRLKFAREVVYSSSRYDTDLIKLVKDNLDVYDADTITRFALDLFTRDVYTDERFEEVKDILGADFNIEAQDAKAKLQELFYTVSALPETMMH